MNKQLAMIGAQLLLLVSCVEILLDFLGRL